MITETDNIEIILPFKAEYVSVVRLTVSGIASRMGFDIDAIEDIKVAVSEVCNKLVALGSSVVPRYKIVFSISEESLDIHFYCEDKSIKCIFGDGNDELGVSLISALMDDVSLCPENDYIIYMSKAIEENI
ncbi:MAG TPA: anti-sigma regulatory factor [Clostridiaceae bacterium]|nr:anti-sigma regulatory factor [Clostridiaceae bacterium]